MQEMTETGSKPIFSGSLHWGGAAHKQKMPLDVPNGPREGEVAGILAFRRRSGETTVTVTWKVKNQPNLSSHDFEYASPRGALDAGWELGEQYEQDAIHMERMRRIYG